MCVVLVLFYDEKGGEKQKYINQKTPDINPCSEFNRLLESMFWERKNSELKAVKSHFLECMGCFSVD